MTTISTLDPFNGDQRMRNPTTEARNQERINAAYQKHCTGFLTETAPRAQTLFPPAAPTIVATEFSSSTLSPAYGSHQNEGARRFQALSAAPRRDETKDTTTSQSRTVTSSDCAKAPSSATRTNSGVSNELYQECDRSFYLPVNLSDVKQADFNSYFNCPLSFIECPTAKRAVSDQSWKSQPKKGSTTPSNAMPLEEIKEERFVLPSDQRTLRTVFTITSTTSEEVLSHFQTKAEKEHALKGEREKLLSVALESHRSTSAGLIDDLDHVLQTERAERNKILQKRREQMHEEERAKFLSVALESHRSTSAGLIDDLDHVLQTERAERNKILQKEEQLERIGSVSCAILSFSVLLIRFLK